MSRSRTPLLLLVVLLFQGCYFSSRVGKAVRLSDDLLDHRWERGVDWGHPLGPRSLSCPQVCGGEASTWRLDAGPEPLYLEVPLFGTFATISDRLPDECPAAVRADSLLLVVSVGTQPLRVSVAPTQGVRGFLQIHPMVEDPPFAGTVASDTSYLRIQDHGWTSRKPLAFDLHRVTEGHRFRRRALLRSLYLVSVPVDVLTSPLQITLVGAFVATHGAIGNW